eukprot:1405054-Amphidinium_carterae.2
MLADVVHLRNADVRAQKFSTAFHSKRESSTPTSLVDQGVQATFYFGCVSGTYHVLHELCCPVCRGAEHAYNVM